MRHHYHRYNGLRGLGADEDLADPKKTDWFWPIAILGVLGAVLLTIKFTKAPEGVVTTGITGKKRADGRFDIPDTGQVVSVGEVFQWPDANGFSFKMGADGFAPPVEV